MIESYDDEYVKSKIIETNCWSARLTYPNSLLLDFGKKIEITHPKTGMRYKGEWSIMGEYCFWRVRKNDTVLCSSYLSEEESGPILKELRLGKLIKIDHKTNDDFTFIFENGNSIDYLCATSEDNVISLFGLNHFCISFNFRDKWNINEKGNNAFNESEEIVNQHSFSCRQRWEKIVPPNLTKSNYCEKCIYYLPLRGHFYFYDFGLCSNSKSLFDGKVVEVKSTCDVFSTVFNNS